MRSGSGPLQCRVLRDDAEAVVVAACGEIDLATKDGLLEVLAARLGGSRPVLLDLSRVTFFDCAALRVLQTARRAHRRFALVAPSPAVLRVLDLAGLQVTAYADASDALTALGPDRPP
jgi:stage II sporulation protein AA (anti-sigma F factor antagonist)